MFDAVARNFFDGFMSADNPQLASWLPRYSGTLDLCQRELRKGAPEDLFELLWKTPDNAVSNAGQGIMGFGEADRLRDGLIDIIRAIERDSGPDNFDSLMERLEHWRAQGELSRVPRLLLARAFAAIHPERYHTTVDRAKQDRVIPWFVEHTGLVAPEGSWAYKAAALTEHLDRCGLFGGNHLHRNIFTWHVFDQLRDSDDRLVFRPGYVERTVRIETDTWSTRTLAVSRRQIHDLIQNQLYKALRDRNGEDCTAGEHATGTGGRADILVKRNDGRYDLYEIKPAAHAAEAVRQALGQLLEYGYWPGGLDPASLYVVSDAPLDSSTEEYLKTLEQRFGLKLNYLHVDISGDGN